jgi:hypothetical protein
LANVNGGIEGRARSVDGAPRPATVHLTSDIGVK